MRYEKTALFADLDDTLFNSRGLVSPEDLSAICAYVAQGGLFAVATGREPRNARKNLPLVPVNGPSVVLNGAGIYDFSADAYCRLTPLNQEAAAAVVAQGRREGWPLDVQVYTPEGILYATPLTLADPAFLAMHQPTRYLPLEELLAHTWLKVVLLEREPEALAPMRTFLQARGLAQELRLMDGTTDVVQVGKYQELLPLTANKGTGLLALREMDVYRGRTFFAAGDYWNDWEMLQEADVACAPENAPEGIKAACHHVLPSHNEHAIAYLIERIIPAYSGAGIS